MCKVHGTGYQTSVNTVDEAIKYGYIEVDISYANLKICPPKVSELGAHLVNHSYSIAHFIHTYPFILFYLSGIS